MSKALINQLSEIEIIFGHLISGNLQLVMSVTWALPLASIGPLGP